MWVRRLIALSVLWFAAVAASPIVQREEIEAAPPYPQSHASTIVELADGTLAAAWFGGTGEGYADVAIWFARRGRAGWEKPVAVARGAGEPTWNPVLFQPRGAPLRLFYKVGRTPNDWRGMVIASNDGGRHWGKPVALPAGVLGPIKNKPLVLADGSWLSPSSREEGVFPDDRWSIRMERSADRGATWRVGAAIASPLGLQAIQPSVLTLRGGALALVARTRQGVLAGSRSADSGRTWSPLVAIDLPNPNAGTDAVTLADGRQLIVYNHAAHWPDKPGYGPRWPLAVALSDDGVRWRRVLTVEDAPLAEGYAYPAVIQTRDGMVHVTYTVDRKLIRHVVIDPARIDVEKEQP